MIDQVIGFPGHITVHRSDRGEYVVGIDLTYGGQTSLSTLGTIQVGNWRAAIIEPSFGGTGVDNGGYTIAVGGNFCTVGAITLEAPEEGSIVSLPARGRLMNRSETLDPEQNLKDLASISQAYDNLSPVAAKGDFVVFDGETNWPMPLGSETQWLAVNPEKPLGMEWKELPSAYGQVMVNGLRLPQRSQLSFRSIGIKAQDDQTGQDSTHISLANNLEALAGISKKGFLVRNTSPSNVFETVETRCLLPGNGIHISSPEGYDDPKIAICPLYEGQKSITTLGHIKHGYWGGTIVDPEFGGTGYSNQHGISLGGEMATSCMVTIGDPDLKAQYVVLNVKGDTRVVLPQEGTIATEEHSLQSRHNLHDIGNPKEAFRHISPTKKRGDLIVRGYGDYDTVIPLGQPGQVLTVSNDYAHLCSLFDQGCISWEWPITQTKVDGIVEAHLKAAIGDIKKAKELVPQTMAGMPIEQVLEAILMQLDHMKHLGTLQPINELRTVLEHWTLSKHKKGL